MRTRGNAVPSRPLRLLGGLGLAASLTIGAVACSSDSGSEDAKPTPTAARADPAVQTALHDAATDLAASPTYQLSGTVVADGATTNLLLDVVGDDRFDEFLISPDNALTETIRIGPDVWIKRDADPWEVATDPDDLLVDTRALFTALVDAAAVSGSSEAMLFTIEEGSAFYDEVDASDVSGQATLTDGKITRLRYGGTFGGTPMLITLDLTAPGPKAAIDPPV
jgi:hypothetical protein